MILPRLTDAPHKYQMYRLLSSILSDTVLAKSLIFKGGTCAVLRGWLDRFSIDLDFDLANASLIPEFKKRLHKLFDTLDFEVKDESQHHLQFFLKYPTSQGTRNTIKLEINDDVSKYNEQEMAILNELNLASLTQTQSTMVANKLVAAIGRYEKHGTVAGRDFYDLHYFLTRGFEINKAIVEERTGMIFDAYINKLIQFMTTKVTDTILYEDLNPLLPQIKLKHSIAHLRQELLWMLEGMSTK